MMDGARGEYGGEQRCVHNFGEETWQKQTGARGEYGGEQKCVHNFGEETWQKHFEDLGV